MTFIDNHNWKLWVSPLKINDQLLSVFKEFIARVERETCQKLKVVRTNNSGEYRGQFKEYSRSKGIWVKFTVPRIPKLNGLAEQMNRTIMERVQRMLAHGKLLKPF